MNTEFIVVSALVVFEVTSKLGKRVRLTEVQNLHITSRHRELGNQTGKMRITLEEPDSVWYSTAEDVHHFYKWFTQTPISEKYLLVIVKHLDDEGFIVTSFFVSKIRKRNKVLVYGRGSLHSL